MVNRETLAQIAAVLVPGLAGQHLGTEPFARRLLQALGGGAVGCHLLPALGQSRVQVGPAGRRPGSEVERCDFAEAQHVRIGLGRAAATKIVHHVRAPTGGQVEHVHRHVLHTASLGPGRIEDQIDRDALDGLGGIAAGQSVRDRSEHAQHFGRHRIGIHLVAGEQQLMQPP